MSEDASHHHGKNEIIIIKRHGNHDHGHHGGAWKIAYADFMTAMMAFFLVMWLINAANEETKAAVASYFNPIKLTDAKPAEKGLKKPGKTAEGKATQEKSETEGKESSPSADASDSGKEQQTTAGEKTSYSEADYFENPYAVLSEIVLEVGEQANVSKKGEGGASDAGPATGADGGEAYRDPFDPDFWARQVEVMDARSSDTLAGNEGPGGFPDIAIIGDGSEKDLGVEPSKGGGQAAADLTIEELAGGQIEGMVDGVQGANTGELKDENKGEDAKSDVVAGSQNSGADSVGGSTNADAASRGSRPISEEEKTLQDILREAAMADQQEIANDSASQTPPVQEKAAEASSKEQAVEVALAEAKSGKDVAEQSNAELQAAAQKLRKKISEELGGYGGLLAEGLTVTPAEGGLLVSISDQAATPMFDVGSAVPKADTVIAMEKIGQVLAQQSGQVVIRGHTDALPFKEGTGDNWTLSMNRARSAYYMLLRGGLTEDRVSQVSGFADRRLKIEDNPTDPRNRRIEILVQGKPLGG